MDKFITFDIETDGLLDDVTKIHCIVVKKGLVFRNYFNTKATGIPAINSGGIMDGVEYIADCLMKGYYVVGHNICGFDLPVFEKLGLSTVINPLVYPLAIHDTYINTCMLNPDRPFSLGYWGTIAGIPKPPHDDWTTLTTKMIKRCQEDVKINEWLYLRQVRKGIQEETWQDARALENEVSWVHSLQTQFGMRVDVLKAAGLVKELNDKADILEKELHKELPMVVESKGVTVTRPFLKSGLCSKMVLDWYKGFGITVKSKAMYSVRGPTRFHKPESAVRICGPFSRITFSPVNLNSHPKVKELLLSLGWKPTEYNQKKLDDGTWVRMSPKLTEDSYHTLPKGVGRRVTKFLMLQHRLRFIYNKDDPKNKGLLSYVRKDGRVPCDGFTCGTNTARYRHSGAFANVPKVETVYGTEIRSLFCVPDGNLMLGTDLSGIEARIMAHYASYYDGGEYTKKVLGSKDGVHMANARSLSCDKKTAKTFLYAISYGAGVGKLASILGCGVGRAKKLIAKFWKENQGLADLIAGLEAEYDRDKCITGLDGRKLFIRHRHKLMNTLIQNAAAIVFKKWMVECNHLLKSFGSSANQLVAYHDELAFELSGFTEDQADRLGKSLDKLLRGVGEAYDIDVPIASEWKVGGSYDKVH